MYEPVSNNAYSEAIMIPVLKREEGRVTLFLINTPILKGQSSLSTRKCRKGLASVIHLLFTKSTESRSITVVCFTYYCMILHNKCALGSTKRVM